MIQLKHGQFSAIYYIRRAGKCAEDDLLPPVESFIWYQKQDHFHGFIVLLSLELLSWLGKSDQVGGVKCMEIFPYTKIFLTLMT